MLQIVISLFPVMLFLMLLNEIRRRRNVEVELSLLRRNYRRMVYELGRPPLHVVKKQPSEPPGAA